MTSNPILKLFTNPYLITSIGILCWSGNFVVGRWAIKATEGVVPDKPGYVDQEFEYASLATLPLSAGWQPLRASIPARH